MKVRTKKAKLYPQSVGPTIQLSRMRLSNIRARLLATLALIPPKDQMTLALVRNASCHGAQLSYSHRTQVVTFWNLLSPQLRLSAKKKTEDGLLNLMSVCWQATTLRQGVWLQKLLLTRKYSSLKFYSLPLVQSTQATMM